MRSTRPLNRTTVAGFTVRFFVERRDAISDGNLRTQTTYQQHIPIYAKDHGWLVQNAITRCMYDGDGIIPGIVTAALEIHD